MGCTGCIEADAGRAMKTDFIKEIKIDESGRLCIFPEKEKFTLIYRSAAEVHWDNDHLFLYSPSLTLIGISILQV